MTDNVKLPDNFDEVVRKTAVKDAEEHNRISRKSQNWTYKKTWKKTFNKKLNSRKWIPRTTNK